MPDTEVSANWSMYEQGAPSTEDVLNHHLQSFGAGDVKGILEDFTEESICITPSGVMRGPKEIEPFFQALLSEFGKPGASFSMDKQIIEDETVFLAWRAETADNVYDMGTDTFWIHDGKIQVQTFAASTTPKA